jgi:glucose-6-phosphate isomerase
MTFLDYPSYKKLQKLAGSPVDLRSALTADRIKAYSAQALGLRLFFATERVSDEVVKGLSDLATEAEAIAKMIAMQRGEVVNFIQGYPSENRPALHTAMRDVFEHTGSEAAGLARQELDKLKNFLPQIDHFTTVVQIGIGGSSLGPEAVCHSLEAFGRTGKKVYFVSNVDPDELTSVFKDLDLSRTAVIVVSKSGSTLETLTNETFARSLFQKAGLKTEKHFISVTGKGSPLDNPAQYLASFYIWDYIGGRYSVTSMVGAVVISFLVGLEHFMEFLKGAHEMDQHALTPDPQKNLPLFSALLGIWNRNFLKLQTVAIIPYSYALRRLPAHLQQLDMESNGKRIDKLGQPTYFETGPVIWGEPGTNGQHSFFQLVHQGTTTVPLEIIGFQKSQNGQDIDVKGTSCQEKLLANLFAQSIALAQGENSDNPNKFFPGNRPNRILLGENLNPRTMGRILAYYEHKVAFQGFMWNINSFDQEGVQLGKVLALKMMSQFAKKKEGSSGNYPLGEAYLRELFF